MPKLGGTAVVTGVVAIVFFSLSAIVGTEVLGRGVDQVVYLILALVPTTIASLVGLVAVDKVQQKADLIQQQTNGHSESITDQGQRIADLESRVPTIVPTVPTVQEKPSTVANAADRAGGN